MVQVLMRFSYSYPHAASPEPAPSSPSAVMKTQASFNTTGGLAFFPFIYYAVWILPLPPPQKKPRWAYFEYILILPFPRCFNPSPSRAAEHQVWKRRRVQCPVLSRILSHTVTGPSLFISWLGGPSPRRVGNESFPTRHLARARRPGLMKPRGASTPDSDGRTGEVALNILLTKKRCE